MPRNEQSRWDYESISNALSSGNGRDLNYFKVQGLQPRIAELAFRRIYLRLHGATAQAKLCDLNLEQVRKLRLPWRLHSRPSLPGHDWEDGDRKRFDVKSNTFYRSKRESRGLRGLFIERSDDRTHRFPGFVFTDSTDDYCNWLYIGEYQPTATIEQKGNRVPPFCFRVPDSERFALSSPDVDPILGAHLLYNQRLRIGWQIATNSLVKLESCPDNDPVSLMHRFVEHCLTITANTFLEYGLWQALTETTFYGCGLYLSESVEAFLDRAILLISDRTFPIRLPCIGDEPLLKRWIIEVLEPLSANWHTIQWPRCEKCTGEPGVPKLCITSLTSDGSIYGRMECRQCTHELMGEATILTHCHGCGHYPLIIGKNPRCGSCLGLVCDFAKESSVRGKATLRCKCCKPSCGKGQQTPDECFLADAEVADETEMCF